MSSPNKQKEIIDVDCVEISTKQSCLSPLSPSQGSVSTDDKQEHGQKRKDSTDTSRSISSKLKTPALPSLNSTEDHISTILNDSSLYLNNEEFFCLIQEDGYTSETSENDIKSESMEKPLSKKKYACRVYKHPANNKSYSDIYLLSHKLYCLYENRASDLFVKILGKTNNKTHKRKRICRWIIEHRKKVSKATFNSVTFPDQYLHSNVLDENKQYVYILQQKLILRLAISLWGSMSEGKFLFFINDYLYYTDLILEIS